MVEQTKPTESYFKTLPETETHYNYEVCAPNDQLGDFATERWTEEDHQKWQDYLRELELKGIRGELNVFTFSIEKSPEFDRSMNSDELLGYPLTSYRFVILEL